MSRSQLRCSNKVHQLFAWLVIEWWPTLPLFFCIQMRSSYFVDRKKTVGSPYLLWILRWMIPRITILSAQSLRNSDSLQQGNALNLSSAGPERLAAVKTLPLNHSLGLHGRSIMLRNDLQMFPGRFAVAFHLTQVFGHFVVVNLDTKVSRLCTSDSLLTFYTVKAELVTSLCNSGCNSYC